MRIVIATATRMVRTLTSCVNHASNSSRNRPATAMSSDQRSASDDGNSDAARIRIRSLSLTHRTQDWLEEFAETPLQQPMETEALGSERVPQGW